MSPMQDHWDINIAQIIAVSGQKPRPVHWARVLLDGISIREDEAKARALLLQEALGPDFKVSMTKWEGRGRDIPLS